MLLFIWPKNAHHMQKSEWNTTTRLQVAAKRADVRLAALGAHKFLDIGLGDDSHPFGYEPALANWMERLWKVLQNKFPLPSGMEEPQHSEIVERAQPAPVSCEIEMRETRSTDKQDLSLAAEEFGYEAWMSARTLDSLTGRLVLLELRVYLTRRRDTIKKYSFTYRAIVPTMCPQFAKVVKNDRITDSSSSNETRHLILRIDNAHQCKYKPGDLAAIWPLSAPKELASIRERLHLSQLDGRVPYLLFDKSPEVVDFFGLLSSA